MMTAGMLSAALMLAGCGNTSINATTEGDSSAESVISVEASGDVLSTETAESTASSDNSADVIAPTVISPTEITGTPTPTPTETPAAEKPGYTVAGINFRASADSGSEVIDTIEPGESVTILGTEGDWTKIRYNGQEGYVSSKYITENKSEAREAAANYYDDDDDGYDSNDYEETEDNTEEDSSDDDSSENDDSEKDDEEANRAE